MRGKNILIVEDETTVRQVICRLLSSVGSRHCRFQAIREVLEVIPITTVPKTPAHMRGVINVRGSVVPVIDMRLRLGMPVAENTVDTCIIVTEITLEGASLVMGVLADAVSEVIDLDSSQIEPPPRFGTRVRTELIKGIGKRNDSFIIILDIDKILASEEIAEVQSASESAV